MVLAVIVVIAGVVLQKMAKAKAHGGPISCLNTLKQVGLGFRLWASDGHPYPGYNPTNEVWQYFQVIGREFGSPHILICPEDYKINGRTAALDFETPWILTTTNFSHPSRRNNSLSYFYSPDASEEQPETILSGDRNISTNKNTMLGAVTVEKDTPVQWTKDPHGGYGNLLFADGSAQQMSNVKLREAFAIQTNITQRLLIP